MSLRNLNLLQFAPAFAASPTSGAELRSNYLARGLANSMEVTHLGFSGSGASSAVEDGDVRFIPVSRDRGYRIADLVRGALGPVPFPVLNYTRPDMKAALAGLLDAARFDFVQLESIHLAGYLPLLRGHARRPRFVVCDWHNIESALLAQSSRGRGGVAGRLYIERQAKLLERYERWFINQCDAHVVVSTQDRDVLEDYGVDRPVFVVPNGVDVPYFSRIGAVPAERRQRVLFVGSMDYHPNAEGAKYFAADVWPDIHRTLPDSVFTIVGRNPSADVRALEAQPGIEVTGSVPDVRPYYREAFAVVVPLRAGGGTRLKILEAMAARVPVISTSIGAEGLSAVPGVHYFEANTPATMRAAVAEARQASPRVQRMTSAAYELVNHHYDWRSLADTLAAELLGLAGATRTKAAMAGS